MFVEELNEIPDAAAEAGIPVVFSANGVSPAVKREADARGLSIVDATCPRVGKVHREVLRFVREGSEIVYIGHNGHDEAVGVVGESPEHVHLTAHAADAERLHAADAERLDFPERTKLVLLSQTTLSVDETAEVIAALQRRVPWIELPPSSDICYATSNRQEAVKLVAQQADCMVIVGSSNSSNSVRLTRGSNCRRARTSAMPRRTGRKPSNSWRSRRIAWSSSVRRTRRTRCGSGRSRTNCMVIVGSANSSNSVRLREVANEALGACGEAHRVADAAEMAPAWFAGVSAVGVSSGASVPDELVAGVVERLQELGFHDVSTVETIQENMHFVLPTALRSV